MTSEDMIRKAKELQEFCGYQESCNKCPFMIKWKEVDICTIQCPDGWLLNRIADNIADKEIKSNE